MNALKEFLHDTTHANKDCDRNGKCSKADDNLVINATGEGGDKSKYEGKITTIDFDYNQRMVDEVKMMLSLAKRQVIREVNVD